MIKQTGFLFKIEPTDFIAGASGMLLPELIPTGDWLPFKPLAEKQYKNAVFDTMSCTTFSLMNIIETWVNYHVEKGNFSRKQLDTLNELGFYTDGTFNCSDRFSAIMSETMRNGNYFQKVLDSVRHDGLLPEVDFPFGGNSWDEYHDKSLITDAMKEKAKKILSILDVSYEWIFDNLTINDELKKCPIQGAIPEIATHAIQIIAPGTMFDTYDPHVAPLPPVRYAMKVIVKVKSDAKVYPTLRLGSKGEFVVELQKLLGIVADGIFGKKTLAAVKVFQVKAGLTMDGIVGPKTWAALKKKA